MSLKFDACDEKEKIFSSMVFESYIKSNNLTEYNHFISDISNRYHKSVNYLKSLREVYVDVYASSNEVSEYKKKMNELNSNRIKFISYCDKLFELPTNEERNEYVISSNILMCDLQKNLEKYKKYNCKYMDQVDDFYAQFVIFYDVYKKNENEKILMDNYNRYCSFFDRMIELGFYNLSNYVQYLSSSYNDFKQNYFLASSYRNMIKKYDEDSWIEYKLLMEENRKKSFLILKDRIELFNSKLKNNEDVDVIDYYMIVGISYREYLQLCDGFISNHDIMRFKRFFSYLGSNSNVKDSYIYNDFAFGLNVNENVVCFLRDNGIPFDYYNYALFKYNSGELDKYIGSSKKLV